MIQKIFTVILVSVLIGTNVFSQSDSTQNNSEIKTLFGNKKVSHGGYGALTFGVDNIDGSPSFHSGIRAAWMIGHNFGLGIAGSGFSNNWDEYHYSNESFTSLSGGSGGILFEPVLFPKFPVHLSFPIVVGAGGVSILKNYRTANYDEDDDFQDYEWNVDVEDFSFYAMVQPGVEVEMNVFKFMRVGLGVQYKLTSGVTLEGKDKDMLDQLSGTFSLKFGKF